MPVPDMPAPQVPVEVGSEPPTPDPLPTVGRIVHFRDGNEIKAAIVTKVWSGGMVNLHVFETNGSHVQGRTSIRYDPRTGCLPGSGRPASDLRRASRPAKRRDGTRAETRGAAGIRGGASGPAPSDGDSGQGDA